jgi:2-succinyl-5-enolpyruvyl-6-hydroxy-3-cyclohexene-1-carboxylate synthase
MSSAAAPAFCQAQAGSLELAPVLGAPEALAAVLGARRGLLVIGELPTPEDVAAASQLAQLLGWPVAADVLSGELLPARGS